MPDVTEPDHHRFFTDQAYAPVVLRPSRLLALVVVVVGAAMVASAVPRPAPAADPSVFAGLGTWIDVYDTSLYRTPKLTADRIARHGVRVVWIETSNDRSTTDVVEAAGLGRLVDELHARGVKAVAWMLPGHDQQARDVRRARAMLSFRTATGGSFDGVALDIESLRLKNVTLRNARMLSLLRRLRAEAGVTPMAAITYPPRALERHASWWPGFPWADIAAQVDTVVPMLYTGGGFKGYDATYGYVARSLRLLHAAIGQGMPIHSAGGVANRMTPEELKAFADAITDDGESTGWSLYDYATMTPAAWASLATLGP
jgi:hypothetical protein